MNSDIKPVNRNTGKLIAKNIIILTVLITVCSLSIWAWFTKNTKATADGISVMAKAEGVEVSWDGINYYYDLTEVEDAQPAADASASNSGTSSTTVKPTTIDRKGPATNICDSNGNPAKLKLITGDGLNFFEPFLNRRTGEYILENGAWKGVEIKESNSHGRYIDVELYFRSTQQRDVYLAKDSSANPKNPTGNASEYGDFSKDNIASASRVAFLDSSKKNVSFIWAPNADNELIESEDGYKKYTTTLIDKGTSSGTLPEELLTEQNGESQYYLWLPHKYLTDQEASMSTFSPYGMMFQEYKNVNGKSLGLYVAEYTVNDPNRTATIPFFINSNSKTLTQSSDKDNINKDSSVNSNISDPDPKVAISGEYFVSNNLTRGFYLSGFGANIPVTITVGYNPISKTAVILKYSADVENGSFDRTGAGTKDTIYFPVENNSKCTLVNSENSVAFSSSEHFLKSVHFKKDTTPKKQNVLPISVTLSELFTAIKDETDGTTYKATYKFQNAKTGEYLSVEGGKVALNGTGSDFYLKYVAEGLGPALVSKDGYCLVFDGNSMSAVEFHENIDQSTVVTVYTGTSYDFIKDSTPEKYYYYNESDFIKNQELTEINANTTPKLYTTNVGEPATSGVLDPVVVSLTKANDSDPYYTGKIVMRIWVEGTDREAKTPLADGIFNLSLHFTYK